MFEHFCGDWAYAEPNFFCELSNNFFSKIFTLVLLDGFLDVFSYVEMILSHTEHMRKQFNLILRIREMNFRACSASCKMWTVFTCTSMLSIHRMNLIAHWAYAEPISSLADHTRKCLKVEYLDRIKYDFQKSRVTGPWDHKVSVSAKKPQKNSCLWTFNDWSDKGLY
jgi:hypothetical protein